MDYLLTKYNQNRRNGRKIIDSDYIIRKRGNFLHVCLNSPGCRYRNSGSCIMCDYGEGIMLTKEKMENIMPYIEKEAMGMQSILIGTLGSVLDSQEISIECLEEICNSLNRMAVETIIFETHYTTINEEICHWLREKLIGKDIVIEVGLESVDEFVQKKCLNKIVDKRELSSKIRLLHGYAMSITANVFLGAPFLTVKEQIEDTEKTIKWAIDAGIDSVVIFPANIRKNTLLNALYEDNKYLAVQHWAVYNLLQRVPDYYLDRIHLAWYGDWNDLDERGENENIPPHGCQICENEWINFYRDFLLENTSMQRKQIMKKYDKILSEICNCRNCFEESINHKVRNEREVRVEQMLGWLEERYN